MASETILGDDVKKRRLKELNISKKSQILVIALLLVTSSTVCSGHDLRDDKPWVGVCSKFTERMAKCLLSKPVYKVLLFLCDCLLLGFNRRTVSITELNGCKPTIEHSINLIDV